MPLLKTWEYGTARFAIWHVTETVEALRQHLSHTVFPYDEEMEQLKSPMRKLEYVATRVLLAHLCGKEEYIMHQPSGKPYCPKGNFHLTISHTKRYVAVGICPDAEIGIDIEYQSSRVMNVISKFLSLKEICQMPQDTEQKNLYALLSWSAKETVFKVLNKDGIDFAEHLQIAPFDLTDSPVLNVTETRTKRQQQYVVHGSWNEAFVCTWCTTLPPTFSAE